MVTVCGDRHWQYISKDTETGVDEFSSGPASNDHAGGWKQENKLPQHIYLNVVGGFIEGTILRENRMPTLVFRHNEPNGEHVKRTHYFTGMIIWLNERIHLVTCIRLIFNVLSSEDFEFCTLYKHSIIVK